MIDPFEPSVSNRFLVTFFFKGIPSPLDIKFQRINGLTRELQVSAYREGGENSQNYYFSDRVQHGSLTLERGLMTVTPLTWVFDRVMSGRSVFYANATILLLNPDYIPVCSWTVSDALPVRWQTSNLDATGSQILINTLELRYQNMIWLGGKV